MKPCDTCAKKKYGCWCKAYSEWLYDDSLPEPILEKKGNESFDAPKGN
jgi:hypothetical protein